jgi:hypothetical protein
MCVVEISGMKTITLCAAEGLNSALLAPDSPSLERAYSITAHCMPRQMPKKGLRASRAYLIAWILPSTPRSPKPPAEARQRWSGARTSRSSK